MIFFPLLLSSESRLFQSSLLWMVGESHLREVWLILLFLLNRPGAFHTAYSKLYLWLDCVVLLDELCMIFIQLFMIRSLNTAWFLPPSRKIFHLVRSLLRIVTFLLSISSLNGYSCRIKRVIDLRYNLSLSLLILVCYLWDDLLFHFPESLIKGDFDVFAMRTVLLVGDCGSSQSNSFDGSEY